jgi:hypothetical protein
MPKLKAPYLKWRDGRPRFEPGPSLRARGFAGRDLRDGHGNWLRTRYEAAQAIAAILEDEPPTRAAIVARRPVPGGLRSLSALCDSLRATDAFGRLAWRTREGYEGHMRLLETWAGDFIAATITRAAIKELLARLRDARGMAMANAVHRTLRLVLNHGVEDLEWFPKNRAGKLKLPQPPGRLVIWEPEEIKTMIAAADWLSVETRYGRYSFEAVGDAIVLAIYTGQSEGDVLAFPELQFTNGEFRGCRAKTKRPFFIPAFSGLLQRLELARARKARQWPNVRFEREVIAPHGRAYTPHHFGQHFALVRAVASGSVFAVEDIARAYGGLPPKLRNLPFTPAPAIAQKNFQDFRDTAVTWLMELLGNIVLVIKITGHSLKSAQAIIDKHYLVRRGLEADVAAKLDAAYAKKLGG